MNQVELICTIPIEEYYSRRSFFKTAMAASIPLLIPSILCSPDPASADVGLIDLGIRAASALAEHLPDGTLKNVAGFIGRLGEPVPTFATVPNESYANVSGPISLNIQAVNTGPLPGEGFEQAIQRVEANPSAYFNSLVASTYQGLTVPARSINQPVSHVRASARSQASRHLPHGVTDPKKLREDESLRNERLELDRSILLSSCRAAYSL